MLQQILKKYWGYSGFRPLQEEIIESIVTGKDTFALLPTGGGKSICYQVPAIASEGCCLVISPLIALMQDQVSRLKELQVPAECIHSGMYHSDVKRILHNTLHGAYKLLYVSPERLQTEVFLEYLPEMDISFIAVDEAHCVSQWGHDFRPDYLKIASLKDILGKKPILALTATATEDVQKDIITQLQLTQPVIYRQSFERHNIHYTISYTENKNREVLELLEGRRETSIIYCRSRKQTEALHKYLTQQGLASLFYHAGMTKEKRLAAQEAWMKNEVTTMIATTAFGMGIDKADVRLVVHFDAPEHIEAYYQETGRAGRDSKPAKAVTLYNKTDINRLINSTALQFPPEEYLRQVYQSVVEYLQIPIGTEPYRYYPFELHDFCKKFELQAIAATNALRLLEQEGLWTISEAVYKPATVFFIANRRELDELAATYPDLGIVATTLLRLYGSLFTYPTPVQISVVARQLKIKQELAEQLIYKLDEMEILEYRKPLDKPQLFFHHYRVDSRHLIIDLQRIARLKQRHQQRTDAIISFLENSINCRGKMLLRYFGEDRDKDCMHCDTCDKNHPSSNYPKEAIKTQIINILSTSGKISAEQLAIHFPAAIRINLITLIREMANEGSLKLNRDGSISVT